MDLLLVHAPAPQIRIQVHARECGEKGKFYESREEINGFTIHDSIHKKSSIDGSRKPPVGLTVLFHFKVPSILISPSPSINPSLLFRRRPGILFRGTEARVN